MPVRKVKPTSNAQRKLSYLVSQLDKVKPQKSLVSGFKRTSGRNSAGQLVVAHKGGGAKRKLRFVDFSLMRHLGKKATVKSVEYDPNRSANIALLDFPEGKKAYILAPDNVKKGETLSFGETAPIRTGNRMQLKNIPIATQIHNVELTNGKGGQLCRSAGSYATLLGNDGKYTILRLPSGETRKVLASNYASIGIISNADKVNVVLGKAGRVRHMGIKPTVLGKSKNPVDHPHGGGEGHTDIGIRKGPKTPWGKPALGRRTMNKKKSSARLIMSRRTK